MDLGPHAIFIWASYAAVFVVLTVAIIWIVLDGRRLKRELAQLQAEGTPRRARGAAPERKHPA